jgi:hypothetical protein
VQEEFEEEEFEAAVPVHTAKPGDAASPSHKDAAVKGAEEADKPASKLSFALTPALGR